MRKIHDQQYTQFTSKERFSLTIAALSRGDESEAERLWSTCPMKTYKARDMHFSQCIIDSCLLGALFFARVIYHYNLIKRADQMIDGLYDDIDNEQKFGLKDLIETSKNLLETVKKAKQSHIAGLKTVYDAFYQFCDEKGIDKLHRDCLMPMPIKDCCHDIDLLLASSAIEPDVEYREWLINYFNELWIN